MTKFLPLSLLLLACSVAGLARGQTPDAAFQAALAHYRANPSDGAATEAVIKLASALEQLPALPEEARRHFVRGGALMKEAKDAVDFAAVATEFRSATQLAPWWLDARHNLSVVLEAQGEYAAALEQLIFYQLGKLSETEARAVQDRIYALEAKAEKAARPAAPAATAPAPKPRSWDVFTGRWERWENGALAEQVEFRQANGQIEVRTLWSVAVQYGGSFARGWRSFTPRTSFGEFDGEKYVLPDLQAGDGRSIHRYTTIESDRLVVSTEDLLDPQTGTTQPLRTEWRRID